MTGKALDRFLPEAERRRISECVAEVERLTGGEIVVMVAPCSHGYPGAARIGATVFAFPLALAFTPELGAYFWLGPQNLWVFLALFAPLWLLLREMVKRVGGLRRVFVAQREMDAEVREAAAAQFHLKGLHRTREENGVLVYVSVFERTVWVMGDRGIDRRVAEGFWQGIVAEVVQGIRDGEAAEAICRAVGMIGGVLREEFPARPDDRDELENMIVEEPG